MTRRNEEERDMDGRDGVVAPEADEWGRGGNGEPVGAQSSRYRCSKASTSGSRLGGSCSVQQ